MGAVAGVRARSAPGLQLCSFYWLGLLYGQLGLFDQGADTSVTCSFCALTCLGVFLLTIETQGEEAILVLELEKKGPGFPLGQVSLLDEGLWVEGKQLWVGQPGTGWGSA